MTQNITKFLREQGIPIASNYFSNLVKSHPEYPSLLSIVDNLDRLGIKYEAAQITHERLTGIDFPYVLHTTTDGGQYIPIKTKSDFQKYSTEFSSWSGIILKVRPQNFILDSQNSYETKQAKLKRNSNIILLLSVLSILGIVAVMLMGFQTWIFMMSSVFGAILGYLLINKDLGISSGIIDSFCKSGETADCDKVLQSNAANIFGVVKLSNIVLSFFITQLLFLIGLSINPSFQYHTLSFFSILSASTLPIIVLSIYYQYAILKTWCRLCLLVTTVLFVQALVLGDLFMVGKLYFNGSVGFLGLLFCLIFLALVSSLTIIREKLSLLLSQESIINELSRIANSPIVFNSLLKHQISVDQSWQSIEIYTGNPEANIQLIMATNLYCEPCRKKHSELNELIKMFPKDICLRFRFTRTNLESKSSPVRYLLALAGQEGMENKHVEGDELINKWYDSHSFEEFRKSCPFHGGTESGNYGQLEEDHYSWIDDSNVTRTPTVFFNGKLLPKVYSVEMLKSVIPQLILAE